MTTFNRIQKAQVNSLTSEQLFGAFKLNGLSIINRSTIDYCFEIRDHEYNNIIARVFTRGSLKNAKKGLWQAIKVLNVLLNNKKPLLNKDKTYKNFTTVYGIRLDRYKNDYFMFSDETALTEICHRYL